MDPAIHQHQPKTTIGSVLWQVLLSLAAALQDVLVRVSTQPFTIVRTHDGYCLPANSSADNVARTPEMVELGEIQEQLFKAGKARAPVIIRLGDDDVLFRGRTFPKAVADVIEPVLHNQIQKLVPWKEDDITFGYVVERQAHSDDQVHAQLAITKQSLIDKIRREARAAGLKLVAIDSTDEATQAQPIQIYSAALDQRERLAGHISRVLIGVTLLSFALSTVGLFQFAHKSWSTYGIENSIAIQNRDLNNALLIQKSREKSDERVEALIARKRDQMPRVTVVNELSNRLPDKTWLDRLEIRNNVIVISGYSDNAAAIVKILDEAEEFTDVKFIGATELSNLAGREKFQISIRISKTREGTVQ